MNRHPATLLDLLEQRAQQDAGAYSFLVDGETSEELMSHADVARRARAIGAYLQQSVAAHEPIVLLLPPGLDYIAAFFGCVYAGMLPVPVYPPNPVRLQRTLPRLTAIVEDAGASVLLTIRPIVALAEEHAQAAGMQGRRWLCLDDVDPSMESLWRPPTIAPDDVAFLQYTSGSTGAPRGVMVTHGNVMSNQDLIASAMRHGDATVGLSWLPMYHDMGLIGHIVQPLYLGIRQIFMSPIAFLEEPLRWPRAISRFGVTTSGAPNFAYDLCARKAAQQEFDASTLDLSSWQLAYCGSEPIRPQTLDRFASTFAPGGFQREAFFPCYGLAEATLFVSGGKAGTGARIVSLDDDALASHQVLQPARAEARAHEFVSCGEVAPGIDLRIVSVATHQPASADEIGEIWIRGDGVAAGYWSRREATRRSFGAYLPDGSGPFLRTGDLGFLHDGQLVVTGRLKDLLVVNGRNYYPQDLEVTVELAHPSLRRGCCAAFSVEANGTERVVLAAEVERRFRPDRRKSSPPPVVAPDSEEAERRRADPLPGFDAEAPGPTDAVAIIDSIRRAVWEEHELGIHAVILLKAGTIPKTSSGKIQRGSCRAAFVENRFEMFAQHVERVSVVSFAPPQTPNERSLAQIWQHVLRLERVALDDNFLALGGDSVSAAQVVWRAREAGMDLHPRDLFDCLTLRHLAALASKRIGPSAHPPADDTEGPAVLSPNEIAFFEDCTVPPDALGEALIVDLPDGMSDDTVRAALDAVVEHHDAFWARYTAAGGAWNKRFVPRRDARRPLTEPTVTGAPRDAQADAQWASDIGAQMRARLSLRDGPLTAACILPPAGGAPAERHPRRLLWVVHRVAIDDVSWVALVEDFRRVCAQLEQGEPKHLPSVSTSAKRWATVLRELAEGDAPRAAALLTAQLDARAHPVPVSTIEGQPGELATASLALDAFATAILMRSIRASGPHVGVADVLVAAVARAAMDRWCPDRAIRIDLEDSARELPLPGVDVSRTVGWLATTVPIRVAPTGGTMLDLLTDVSAQLTEISRQRIGIYVLRHVDSADARRALARAVPAQLRVAYSAVPLTGAQWLTRLGPTARLSPTTIEVRGQIIGNQFRAVFSFDPRAYTMDVIRSLREGCLAAIESLIEEPSSVEAPLPKIPGSKLDRSELERRVMAGAQAARRHNDR